MEETYPARSQKSNGLEDYFVAGAVLVATLFVDDIVDVSSDLLHPLVIFIKSSPITIISKIRIMQKASQPGAFGAT